MVATIVFFCATAFVIALRVLKTTAGMESKPKVNCWLILSDEKMRDTKVMAVESEIGSHKCQVYTDVAVLLRMLFFVVNRSFRFVCERDTSSSQRFPVI